MIDRTFEVSPGGALVVDADIASDLAVTASELKDGHLRGALNGGGQPIEIRTSGGNIRLRAAN